MHLKLSKLKPQTIGDVQAWTFPDPMLELSMERAAPLVGFRVVFRFLVVREVWYFGDVGFEAWSWGLCVWT